MILTKLCMKDFRIYAGSHEVDLSPKVKYGKSRPVILFGGLNGAGKTSLLMAIRLTLYGRQSLGRTTPKKDYLEFLEKCIHRSSLDSEINDCSVALEFTYAHEGKVSDYRVDRVWVIRNGGIQESLSISKGGIVLDELNQDQCQSFLNELIPIGLSDLFFFDGEKIADFAHKDKGSVLGASIKKLMGLDLIEALQADLSLYLRKSAEKRAPAQIRKQISELEKAVAESKRKAEEEIREYQQLRVSLIGVQKQIQETEEDLLSMGGAWAQSRESEIKKFAKLEAEQTFLEATSRDLLSNMLPLAYCPKLRLSVQTQMTEEESSMVKRYESIGVQKSLGTIKESIFASADRSVHEIINTAIDAELSKVSDTDKDYKPVLDVSRSVQNLVQTSFAHADTEQKNAAELNSRLSQVREQIESISVNLSRAPEEELLAVKLKMLNRLQGKRAELMSAQQIHTQRHKAALRDAADGVKSLIKLYNTIDTLEDVSRSNLNASIAKELLKDFSLELTKSKVKELETEFSESFARLARKEDILLHAKIDSVTFDVTLVNDSDYSVSKEELSAGERQIYAIAMLDALAKTSGRNLPVIIDTPLGRLDSYHRKKLVDNYFPHASHQVIVLSTDTEIDQNFFEGLSASVSRSYELDYDPKSKSSSIKKGYFWKQQRLAI